MFRGSSDQKHYVAPQRKNKNPAGVPTIIEAESQFVDTQYGINPSAEQLAIILEHIEGGLQNTNIARKKLHHELEYTILKADENNFYIIGKGEEKGMHRDKKKNAFIGAGKDGRLKAARKISKIDTGYVLHDQIYAVKTQTNANCDFEKEAQIYREVHGEGFFIKAHKNYLIMQMLPGIELLKFNYARATIAKLADITVSVYKNLLELHRRSFAHKDLHSGNVLYDEETKKTYIIDMGQSIPITELSLDDKKTAIAYDLDSFANMIGLFVSNYVDELNNQLPDRPFAIDLGELITTIKETVMAQSSDNMPEKLDEMIIKKLRNHMVAVDNKLRNQLVASIEALTSDALDLNKQVSCRSYSRSLFTPVKTTMKEYLKELVLLDFDKAKDIVAAIQSNDIDALELSLGKHRLFLNFGPTFGQQIYQQIKNETNTPETIAQPNNAGTS